MRAFVVVQEHYPTAHTTRTVLNFVCATGRHVSPRQTPKRGKSTSMASNGSPLLSNNKDKRIEQQLGPEWSKDEINVFFNGLNIYLYILYNLYDNTNIKYLYYDHFGDTGYANQIRNQLYDSITLRALDAEITSFDGYIHVDTFHYVLSLWLIFYHSFTISFPPPTVTTTHLPSRPS